MQAQAAEVGKTVVTALSADRKAMYGADLLRSLLFMAAGLALVWFFAKGKLNALTVAIAMLVLVTFDLIPVGKRYLKADNFVEQTNIEEEFAPSAADKMVMQDPNYKNIRVFNTDDPFNNAKPSYHFNSVKTILPF